MFISVAQNKSALSSTSSAPQKSFIPSDSSSDERPAPAKHIADLDKPSIEQHIVTKAYDPPVIQVNELGVNIIQANMANITQASKVPAESKEIARSSLSQDLKGSSDSDSDYSGHENQQPVINTSSAGNPLGLLALLELLWS